MSSRALSLSRRVPVGVLGALLLRQSAAAGADVSGPTEPPSAEPATAEPASGAPASAEPQSAESASAPAAPSAEKAEAPAEEEGPALGWDFDGFWLTPLIGPAYTPELGFLIAGGAMLSFVADEGSPRSSVPITIGYGTVGAIVGSAQLRSYFFADTWRLDVDVWFKDMTDHYFGVGYDAAKNTELGDQTTKYHRRWFQLEPTVLRRVVSDLFVGAIVDLNQSVATELNPQMAMDPYVVAGGTEDVNFGAGPVLRFDSRDFPQNAYRGVYFQASYLPYFTKNGNLDGYQILDLDYRQYLSLGREGSTLAWNARTRIGFHDVPWSELGMLGSPFDLRGYRWGRYRQKTIAYGIVEYRFNFSAGSKPDGSVELSPHGVVGWVGAGTLGEGVGSLEGVLPNIGVGYRLAVQGRLNMRVDIGIGSDSQAFYFNFNEAF